MLPAFACGALLVGLAWAVSCLRTAGRQRRRGRSPHVLRGQGEAVTVAELLDEAAERSDGIRLNWPEDDLDRSPIRPDDRGQFPTVILPRVE